MFRLRCRFVLVAVLAALMFVCVGAAMAAQFKDLSAQELKAKHAVDTMLWTAPNAHRQPTHYTANGAC